MHSVLLIPVIIDIVDAHENTKKHFNVRKAWYESRNGQISTARNLDDACWTTNGQRLIDEYHERMRQIEATVTTQAAKSTTNPTPTSNTISPVTSSTISSVPNKSMGHTSGTELHDSHAKAVASRLLAHIKK